MRPGGRSLPETLEEIERLRITRPWRKPRGSDHGGELGSASGAAVQDEEIRWGEKTNFIAVPRSRNFRSSHRGHFFSNRESEIPYPSLRLA